MMITWTRGLCFRRQLPCARCSWEPPGQCPVIVSALMSGELGRWGSKTSNRGESLRVQSLSCNLLTTAKAHWHRCKQGEGRNREFGWRWWKREMVYSEHRFLPNLGWARTHGELPASNVCCRSKNESLGDEKHIFHALWYSNSSLSFVFCHNFLGRHRLQFSALQHGGDSDFEFAVSSKGKYKNVVQMLIRGILILFPTGCELANFNPWGATSSLLQPDAASLTSELYLLKCLLCLKHISIAFFLQVICIYPIV